MKFVTIFFVTFFTIANATSMPQGCTAITNHYYDRRGQYDITVSSNISIDADPNYLIISNISVDYASPDFFKTFCVVPSDGQILCLSDFTKSLRFPLQNSIGISLFHIDVSVNNTMNSDEFYRYIIFPTVFDEGSFSLDSGEIFSDMQRCVGAAKYDRHGKIRFSINQCCTSFKPVHQYPGNVTACQKFKSRTTVYNVDDNYSIFATTQVNYSLAGNNMTVNGESMGPDDLKIWIGINAYESCYVSQNSNETCTFSLPVGDSKFLINTEYENSTIPVEYHFIVQDYTILVGRLIIRNGVAMMAESDPFTPENNCNYYNLDFSPNQVVSSSLCCTQF